MVLSKLLVILIPPLDARSAAVTVQRARETAARPLALRFALPGALQHTELPADAESVYYDDVTGLESIPELLMDESAFLCITGEHAFRPKWDSILLRHLRILGRKALLTGSITPAPPPVQETPVALENAPTLRLSLASLRASLPELQKRRDALPDTREKSPARMPEVCLPALKESLHDESVSIGRGLPLICAAAPVKTLVIDPAFLFGPISFLQEATLSRNTLSLAAYITAYSVFVPPEAPLWPLADPPPRELTRPSAEALPGTTLSRFEQLLGFRYGQRSSVGKTAMGLFTADDTYSQRMPARERLTQSARTAKMKLLEKHMPLLVSAFIDLPTSANSPAFYQLRFGFLRRIESLPLLLFTGGSQERALRASFPNAHSYPSNHLLPRSLMTDDGMQPYEHFTRSKPMLMLRAAKRQLEFTHTAWVDMDILPHPVCTEAVPDLEPFMDDRIHIATVNGIPDASFIVIPTDLLSRVAKETLSITQLDAELKRGLSEALLWERLCAKHPDWFTIHPMPTRRLLFLSAFDATLLSQPIQSLLRQLSGDKYGVQRLHAAPQRKETKPNG